MHGRDVVLYGPPIAGKTTLLVEFAQRRGLSLERFRPDIPRHTPAPGLGVIDDVGIAVRVADGGAIRTISGTPWNDATWPSLLRGAAVMGLCLEARLEREFNNVAHVASLLEMGVPRVGCLIFTRRDLVEGGVERMREVAELVQDSPLASWPCFLARRDEPESLVAPLEWLLAARDVAPS